MFQLLLSTLSRLIGSKTLKIGFKYKLDYIEMLIYSEPVCNPGIRNLTKTAETLIHMLYFVLV